MVCKSYRFWSRKTCKWYVLRWHKRYFKWRKIYYSRIIKLEPALKALENNGFDVVKVGNTTIQKTSSIINRTKQKEDAISKLKSLLNIKSKTTTGKDNVDADLTITLGKDYK